MDPNSVDQIYSAFANHGPAIQAALMSAAMGVFATLAVIEITLAVGKALAHKTDLLDIIFLVTNQLITIGFFLFLLQNWADFAKNITDDFAWAGGQAATALGGTATMMPVGAVMAGANMAKHVWEATKLSAPFVSAMLLIAGLITVLVFGYIACLMVEVLIECFFAAYVGTVMMMFGASVYTRDMAISQFRYAISVGVKRLVMQLVMGVGEAIINGWATKLQNNAASFTWKDIALIIVVPIILVRLAQRLPNIAQDVCMGAHIASHGSLFSTGAQIARAMSAAAISVTGAAAALTAAAGVASKAMGAMQASGTAPASRVAQAAMMSKMAATAAAKGIASDVGSRLSGHYSAAHGYRGFRVAAALKGDKP